MSVILLPGQTPTSSIVTQTRMGFEIPNVQSLEASNTAEYETRLHQARYPSAKFRTGPIPIYNCHGLTFGCRRTAISDPIAVRRILVDDRYAQIHVTSVRPGDVILYVSVDGDIEHSGIVVEMPPTQPVVPIVWSKWGFLGEVVHPANCCPYDFTRASYHRIQS